VLESFITLKEIDSLMKMKAASERQMQEEQQRLEKLQQQRQSKQSLKQAAHTERLLLKQRLMELEQQIKNFDQQLSRLRELGGDEKKIQEYLQLINQAEEAGLQLLSEQEAQELIISEADEFLSGLERTLLEIGQEVADSISLSTNEVQQLELRLTLLLEALPEQFRATFLKIKNKQLAHGPFTRIEAGSCYFCRYKLSRLDESEIDMQKGLKTCQQCGRIFLPYGS
jgi:predicted  nucleic acid-binding Zn-ribbon protein